MGCLCCCDLFLLPAVVATTVTDSEHMLAELELIKQIITGSTVTQKRDKTEVVCVITALTALAATCKVEKATSGSNTAATVGIATPKFMEVCNTAEFHVLRQRREARIRVEQTEAMLLGRTRVVSQRAQWKD